MYGATNKVLDDNLELFKHIPGLVTAHLKLKAGLVMIDQNRLIQEADTSGLTDSKSEARTSLNWLILQFSSALMAYATEVDDLELKVKAKYVPSELDVIADSNVYDIGSLLYNLAVPVKAELEKYFVDDAKFKEMESLLVGFKSAIPKGRVAKSVSKTSTGNISQIFKMMDKLLKEKIDSLMNPFQFSHSDFYNAYKSARMVIGYTGRTKTNPQVRRRKNAIPKEEK